MCDCVRDLSRNDIIFETIQSVWLIIYTIELIKAKQYDQINWRKHGKRQFTHNYFSGHSAIALQLSTHRTKHKWNDESDSMANPFHFLIFALTFLFLFVLPMLPKRIWKNLFSFFSNFYLMSLLMSMMTNNDDELIAFITFIMDSRRTIVFNELTFGVYV